MTKKVVGRILLPIKSMQSAPRASDTNPSKFLRIIPVLYRSSLGFSSFWSIAYVIMFTTAPPSTIIFTIGLPSTCPFKNKAFEWWCFWSSGFSNVMLSALALNLTEPWLPPDLILHHYLLVPWVPLVAWRQCWWTQPMIQDQLLALHAILQILLSSSQVLPFDHPPIVPSCVDFALISFEI